VLVAPTSKQIFHQLNDKTMNKSNNNQIEVEHVFVKNPFTGNLINVLPLFKLMDECSHFNDSSTKNLVGMIQDVHDFTSSRIDLEKHNEARSEFESVKSVNHNLILLRKTFEAMEEFKS
jgi:antitoxin component YwqK of YwqJK toxin-antitoxin module